MMRSVSSSFVKQIADDGTTFRKNPFPWKNTQKEEEHMRSMMRSVSSCFVKKIADDGTPTTFRKNPFPWINTQTEEEHMRSMMRSVSSCFVLVKQIADDTVIA
jgi:hypothetical protein